jgi:hypothetical protein
MRRFYLFVFTIFLISCVGGRFTETASFKDSHLSFSKVKLKMSSSSLGSINMKGYIYFVKDSLLCFKFFGPFSFELFSGRFDKVFTVYDAYNKRRYDDILNQILTKEGIAINLRVLQDLFSANQDSLQRTLQLLNKGRLEFETGRKVNQMIIKNSSKHVEYQITWKKKHNLPTRLFILYRDSIETSSLDFEFVSISNDERKCNFEF